VTRVAGVGSTAHAGGAAAADSVDRPQPDGPAARTPRQANPEWIEAACTSLDVTFGLRYPLERMIACAS
jgi:hypothetical protein